VNEDDIEQIIDDYCEQYRAAFGGLDEGQVRRFLREQLTGEIFRRVEPFGIEVAKLIMADGVPRNRAERRAAARKARR
jgi:hypothetical protein